MTKESIAFMVPGSRNTLSSSGVASGSEPLPRGMTGTIRDSVSIGANRSSGQVRIEATPGRDVVLLKIADGPDLILHPQHAKELFRTQLYGAEPVDETLNEDNVNVEVPVRLAWEGLVDNTATDDSSTRGLIQNVILKTIEIVTGVLVDKAADVVSAELIGRIDSQVNEGVYRLQSDKLTSLKDTTLVKGELAGVKHTRALVLIHGTFSNTASSFGRLWTDFPQQVDDLFKEYNNEVFALDHRTLALSPIDNAITLIDACAQDCSLHLLTHSRGGLVAEVLVRAAALATPDEAITLFDAPGYNQQAQALRTLVHKIREKRISVERVVRVACPARGTLLASKRLDAYLSVFRWALKLAHIPVFPELVEFIEAVAAKRLMPDQMPGLQAMVPDSPLIQWLHAAEEPVSGELRVIAGDIRGESVVSWLKTLVADAYYWTDNDLVVHTSSMYGGVPRSGKNASRFIFKSGANVTHFGYFQNATTATAVVNGLIQNEPADFERIGPLSYSGDASDGLRGPGVKPDPTLPALFILPGILGSHLAIDNKRIWMSWRWFFKMEQLAYPEPSDVSISADGTIGSSYEALQDYLRQTHDVHEFPFDWRRPIEEEARRLSVEITTELEARRSTHQPVRIIAHSMGGIVVRAMQFVAPELWDRLLSHDQARIVFLGTPHEGSWAPMQVLTGDDTLGNALVGIGSPNRGYEGRQIIAQFPGLLQLQAGLLPPMNLGREETWKSLARADKQVSERYWRWHHNDDVEAVQSYYRWGIPSQSVLDQAVSFRDQLDDQIIKMHPDHRVKLANVLGQASATPNGFAFNKRRGLVYEDVENGDGRVTRHNAMLADVATWQVACKHGNLPSHADAFEAYLEILNTGKTDRLISVVPVDQRNGTPTTSSAVRYSRPSRTLTQQVLPPSEDFFKPHYQTQESMQGDVTALQVAVENADLTFVGDSLLLGHYRSSSLHGTEAVANKLINGTMEESLMLGQYPDQPGSNRIFANLGVNRSNSMLPSRPDCVVVVGLGEEGTLGDANLAYTVRMGVLARAQQHFESLEETPSTFRIAATLIASGGYGVTAGLSAQNIVNGVLQANQAIRDINARYRSAPDRQWPQVSHLRLVELYSSRATEAWLALKDLAKDSKTRISVEPQVKMGQGAMKRLDLQGYRGASSDILSAITEGHSGISYTVATRRARTEVRAKSTQMRLVKRLVEQASNEKNQDHKISRTLFQLLLPDAVRTIVNTSAELQLELDEGTAGIPWELLNGDKNHDTDNQGYDPDSLPWAIRCKLIRKLRLENFRHLVIDASKEASILIIGEPDCDSEKYARLPGARREALAILNIFKDAGVPRIYSLISKEGRQGYQPSEVEVLNAISNHECRIIHISGHGEPPRIHDSGNSGSVRSSDTGEHGVVLANGTFLGPNEIEAMSVVPEFVFMNCCHLAASDSESLLKKPQPYDRAEFAAGIARDLINIGVKCVIAAGWAVQDEQAQIFGETFYRQLLNGERFIEAVAVARKAAYHKKGNTWAAYQCYGDPDWTFKSSSAIAVDNTNTFDEHSDIGSPDALIVELENLATRSRFQNTDVAELCARLNDLDRRFGLKWGEAGAVAEAFADAWSASGSYDIAIRWYAKARTADDSGSSLRATERLANFQVRQAWAKVKQLDKLYIQSTGKMRRVTKSQLKQGAQEARKTIKESLQLIKDLLSISETIERHALCGSSYKRLAMIARLVGTPRQEKNAVTNLVNCYQAAETFGLTMKSETIQTYALQNLLCAQYVSAAYMQSWKGLDSAQLAELRHRIARKSALEPDFWNEVGLIEIDLLELLSESALSHSQVSSEEFIQRSGQISSALTELYDRVQSRDQWSSVVDQLDFITRGCEARINDPVKSEAVALIMTKLIDYSG